MGCASLLRTHGMWRQCAYYLNNKSEDMAEGKIKKEVPNETETHNKFI